MVGGGEHRSAATCRYLFIFCFVLFFMVQKILNRPLYRIALFAVSVFGKV